MSIPILSQVEHVALVNRLPVQKRFVYVLVSTLVIWTGFAVAIGLSLLLAILLFGVFVTPLETTNDVVILAIPIVCAVLALVGFSSHPGLTHVRAEDHAASTFQRTFKAGLWRGLVGGLVFGMLWSLTLRVSNIYIELNTILDVDFRADELLVYSLLIALAVAPTFALLRAITSVSSHLVLYWLAPDAVRSSAP